MKKDGGTIKNWQLHTLSASVERVIEIKGYDIQTDKCYVFTGTVVNDPTGRWRPGYHMRSSVISKMDLENGIIETQNTIYHMEGESGGDMFPDLGDGVAAITY